MCVINDNKRRKGSRGGGGVLSVYACPHNIR